ncbi:UPF0041-domain-containing protein [Corynespora cassiicola Philippines]|uniref:Mitochondrial pyruvate carrier n=1 Tax=Corynespora cassiicola Philippines TaxID=1448308 RepID=A0A2T2NUQ5_CORCC|nr:UPF0041-domain-containing protein [Corynespora cassiicola Philippines]
MACAALRCTVLCETEANTKDCRAPILKWAVVLGGVSDLTRPAEQLSLNQNAALTATGAIWTRWCFVIKPRNVFLASVNFALFLVGSTQVTRIYLYNRSLKDTEGQAKAEGKELKEDLKEVAEKAEKAIKS